MLSVKFELAFKWKRLYIVGMIYKFLILCFGLLLMSFQANARGDGFRRGPKTINIYAPYFKAVPTRSKIYTPDRYRCSMRRNLKYCVDIKGHALTGQIVVTDGNVVAYENYQNGYQHGETSIFTTDGNLAERIWYRKGLRDGEATEYYLNGNVWLVKQYDDGVLHGRVEEYDNNGVLIGKMTYKKGWFKDGYCANEKSGKTMHDRFNNGQYNQIIPCSGNNNGELM